MQLLQEVRPIEDFVPNVLIHASGNENSGALPKEAAIAFVRNSAIQFADKTGVLKRKIKVDLQCGLSEYPIETLNCETIVGVKSVSLGDFNATDCGCSWSWGNIYFEFDDDILKIDPAPTKDIHDGLYAEVIVIPSRDACELDAQLYTKYLDAIVDGALSEIHSMPDQPWSSVTRADYRNRRFNEEISRITMRKVMKGRREPLHATPPHNFIIGRSQRKW